MTSGVYRRTQRVLALAFLSFFIARGDNRIYNESDVEYPCNIERVQMKDLSWERFIGEYWNQKPFILVEGLDYNSQHRSFTTRRNMLEKYGEEIVSLGTANSYTGRKGIRRKLVDYLNYMSTEQPADRLGENTWYLFGDNREAFWKDVLSTYVSPPFSDPESPFRPDELQARTLAFGMGGKFSGVPFHTHGPGWSEVLHGRKRWFIVPHVFGEDPKKQFSDFDPEKSQMQWVEEKYETFGQQGTLSEGHNLYECVIVAGEALYFPTHFFHATLNLDAYTVFVSAFT